MKIIELKKVETEPTAEEFRLYPDYLVNRLVKLGIGRIEADRKIGDKESVDFIFTSHQTGKSEVMASVDKGFFRPLLARLGPRFGAEDMLYLGQTCFACEAECEGQKRLHRFALFVCNEPTMDIWMKLYFYCIDGIWPMRKEAT
jgi:hypothetical protein